ncbi:MAG TPA: metallophosphoesterase family protein [Terriglobales bacterium]|nr:metallophosphoesterase family protein [Terriglobales bacterium]
MRILIYSDIHANLPALEAMAAATAGGYDVSVCLGDVVGYGAQPNQTSAWVRAATPTVIRGNHDRACAALHGLQWFNPTAAAAARWTHHVLEEPARQWLDELPAGPLPWEGMSLVHGSPLDEDEYLVEPAQAAGAFAATEIRLQWFGHTHIQGGFEYSEEEVSEFRHGEPGVRQSGSFTLRLQAGARYLLNPGSVGQPRDGDWRAAYAILHQEDDAVTFHRVPYDLAAAQASILQAGLPAALAQRLAKGQ